MLPEDWKLVNELLDEGLKRVEDRIDENAGIGTRERALLDGKIERLAARLELAEFEIEDLETSIDEEGDKDDS